MLPKGIIQASAMDEETLRKSAEILGPSSASAKALAELERRRDAGEQNVIVIQVNGAAGPSILIGPDPRIEQSISDKTAA